uniref:LRAT domain-containing protein n=1 Tax=Helicotheca tamesis TaxID=374047 RepID=A0A7S2MPW6_9STRA|mmetsp:Transcript_19619/g.26930  ORF Transcript_19619/g.26930 Transcript_19619/m.26930 type:complete len:324 (+) Transcript_19619:115-1086(+)|eukprot:CAMPEP_0185729948 /NCGR_PEP_ID=MMETSP1171-20130828/7785_1 /TAXON_ID=374046 /ORGANISM="Helicotheca tamensis, Strain CCMP826" /LENGTH=323 /DNA_ID=CAMNT_0028398899 /DNA_START=80 /DNA_END=1051 /DNA_ORIENTATION=+
MTLSNSWDNESDSQGSDNSSLAKTVESNFHDKGNGDSFRVGDHVYKRCSVGGIQEVYTHHGIVVEVRNDPGVDGEGQKLTILDFSCESKSIDKEGKCSSGGPKSSNISSFNSTGSCASSGGSGFIRMCDEPSRDWNKVLYSCTEEHKHGQKGTCTGAAKDDDEVVLRRIEFIKSRSSFNLDPEGHLVSSITPPIPSYDVVKANCECFAVWIATGYWSSVQGLTVIVSVGTGAAISVVASAAVVLTEAAIPMAGPLGWVGFTTTTSLAAVCPWLIPVAVGASAVGGICVGRICVGIITAKNCNNKLKVYWIETSNKLNHAMSLP